MPLTIGVSLNASMPTETLGVDGINAGSQNGSLWYCQVVGSSRLQGLRLPWPSCNPLSVNGWLKGGTANGSML